MPEQLTKHPQVTLDVLRSAGAQCGEGAAQQILHACPAARFCKLPGGEICVYGLADAGQMTQITAQDLQALSAPASPNPATADRGLFAQPLPAAVAALLVGLAIGAAVARIGRR